MATTFVDLPCTYAQIVYGGSTPDDFVTTLGDEDETGEIVITTSGPFIYPVKWDDGPDFQVVLPDPPDGYTLTGAFYVVKGYREADTGGGDSSDFGFNPNPDDAPFLLAETAPHPVIDHLPIGGYDGLVVGRWSDDLDALATDDTANFAGSGWHISNIQATFDGVVHVCYMALRLVYDNGSVDTPCDTWVDLDLSTAVFSNPDGTDQFGQYVDGVITGDDDGDFPQYAFAFDLDATKPYKVEITFDPASSHDAGERWVLLRNALPGTALNPDGVQIGDGFSNTSDVCTLTIGPGVGNWDDPDQGVAQGYTLLIFQTAKDGAVSAIRIRKLCTFTTPPLVQWPRNDGLGASSARVLWPIPKTEQASNLRGPSAIL